MRQVTTNIYTFSELNDEAKAKAIDDARYINVDYHAWGDWILEDAKSHLEAQGYPDADIRYSGFSSQGDGASFTSTVDLCQWLKAHKLANKRRGLYNAAMRGDVSASITRSDGHYSHEYTIRASVEQYEGKQLTETDLMKLEEKLTEDAREESRKIYEELEKAYDSDTTDEAILEALEANGLEFTEEGRRV